MNFRRLRESDLSNFAANVGEALTGAELTAIDANVRAALVTALGTLPDLLAEKAAGAMVADDMKRVALSERNEVKASVSAVMVQVRELLKAGRATRQQFALCGFDYPFTTPSRYIAEDPTGLSASGSSIGVNTIRFTGNNIAGRVTYEIWRRLTSEGEWAIMGTTMKQRFTDTPVTPGQYYEYKVRAVAARSASNFSNPAVVYGVL